MRLGLSFGLAARIASTVTPYIWAILDTVSPFLTVYVRGVALGGGSGLGKTVLPGDTITVAVRVR
jgi:hypothetical protein